MKNKRGQEVRYLTAEEFWVDGFFWATAKKLPPEKFAELEERYKQMRERTAAERAKNT